jgi:hypothetical protein
VLWRINAAICAVSVIMCRRNSIDRLRHDG